MFKRKAHSDSITMKADGPVGAFAGYGSVFGNVDSDGDAIAAGAFSLSLAEHKAKGTLPRMLFGHQRDRPIGDYQVMREDDHGLWLEGQLWVDGDHPNADALTARRLMQGPGGAGLSIGFYIREDKYDRDSGIRTITQAKLMEVSVVTFPANDAANTVGVKAAADIQTPRDFEEFLRDAGFSRGQAKAIAARGFKAKDDSRDATSGSEDDPREAATMLILEALRTVRPA